MREFFEVDDGFINLNPGTQSLTPKSVFEAMDKYRKEYYQNLSMGYYNFIDLSWQAQKRLADFLGANPHHMFVTHNVTYALNMFILGFQMEANKDEILTSNLEYGATFRICHLKSQNDQHPLRTFELLNSNDNFEDLTKEILIDRVISAIGPQTKMLVLSHIYTGNGLVLPVLEIAKKIKEEFGERNIAIVIDGAHAAGFLDLNMSDYDNISFYGGNLHKWMMGPAGTAFGWVNSNVHNALKPIMGGWTTSDVPGEFKRFGGGDEFTLNFSLKGTLDYAPFLAINDVLDFWEARGKANIRNRVSKLQLVVEKQMSQKLGWKSISPKNGDLRGPLLSFELPNSLEEKGLELFLSLYKDKKLQVAMPKIFDRFIMRLSAQVYNTEEEVDQATSILSKI
jgi:isopenicillin-N epimerase